MALNGLIRAEVPLRNYSLTHPANAGIVFNRLPHQPPFSYTTYTYMKSSREGPVTQVDLDRFRNFRPENA